MFYESLWSLLWIFFITFLRLWKLNFLSSAFSFSNIFQRSFLFYAFNFPFLLRFSYYYWFICMVLVIIVCVSCDVFPSCYSEWGSAVPVPQQVLEAMIVILTNNNLNKLKFSAEQMTLMNMWDYFTNIE